MSQGIGHLQRRLVGFLARGEITHADLAQQQERYEPPTAIRSVEGLLKWWVDGDPVALAHVKAHHDAWEAFSASAKEADGRTYSRRVFDPADMSRFHTKILNIDRMIASLTKRGLVQRDPFGGGRGGRAVALTQEGFAAARRFGLIPNSEIVDLDEMQGRWQTLWRLAWEVAPAAEGAGR